jgi:hypothetical protein
VAGQLPEPELSEQSDTYACVYGHDSSQSIIDLVCWSWIDSIVLSLNLSSLRCFFSLVFHCRSFALLLFVISRCMQRLVRPLPSNHCRCTSSMSDWSYEQVESACFSLLSLSLSLSRARLRTLSFLIAFIQPMLFVASIKSIHMLIYGRDIDSCRFRFPNN